MDKEAFYQQSETIWINSQKGPTPAQVEAEVWMSLIHGSRGIVYFAHEWEPVFREARLLEDAEMLAAVTRINAQIGALAPVLNSAETVEVAVAAAVRNARRDTERTRGGSCNPDEELFWSCPLELLTLATSSEVERLPRAEED